MVGLVSWVITRPPPGVVLISVMPVVPSPGQVVLLTPPRVTPLSKETSDMNSDLPWIVVEVEKLLPPTKSLGV